jgi:hypothetical protein
MLPSGQVIYNPLRVMSDGSGDGSSEVVFSLRRLPGMTDEDFAGDAAAVAADLASLKRIVEGR